MHLLKEIGDCFAEVFLHIETAIPSLGDKKHCSQQPVQQGEEKVWIWWPEKERREENAKLLNVYSPNHILLSCKNFPGQKKKRMISE